MIRRACGTGQIRRACQKGMLRQERQKRTQAGFAEALFGLLLGAVKPAGWVAHTRQCANNDEKRGEGVGLEEK